MTLDEIEAAIRPHALSIFGALHPEPRDVPDGIRTLLLLGPAETMNVNAANALLKCLEEPSPGTHLLLFAHRPAALHRRAS